jgi:hypothetical protein
MSIGCDARSPNPLGEPRPSGMGVVSGRRSVAHELGNPFSSGRLNVGALATTGFRPFVSAAATIEWSTPVRPAITGSAFRADVSSEILKATIDTGPFLLTPTIDRPRRTDKTLELTRPPGLNHAALVHSAAGIRRESVRCIRTVDAPAGDELEATICAEPTRVLALGHIVKVRRAKLSAQHATPAITNEAGMNDSTTWIELIFLWSVGARNAPSGDDRLTTNGQPGIKRHAINGRAIGRAIVR